MDNQIPTFFPRVQRAPDSEYLYDWGEYGRWSLRHQYRPEEDVADNGLQFSVAGRYWHYANACGWRKYVDGAWVNVYPSDVPNDVRAECHRVRVMTYSAIKEAQ